MALPVVEYFNVDEQNYSIEIPVDDRLTFPEDNAVESEAVAAAKATLPDLSTKQPRKVSESVLNAMLHAGITAVRTVEECIRAFISGIASAPRANDLNLLTSGGAYADKADYPEASGRRNLTNTHIAEFFMNSPTPESWLGKVLGPRLGKTWTQGSITSSYVTRAIYYVNGIWVATGNGLWWSTDGKSWTQGSGTAGNSFACVYYGNGIWVAGSTRSGFWWSTDGMSWTHVVDEITDSLGFECVYYGNGIWVAGSTRSGLWWSTDGKTWTQSLHFYSSPAFETVYYANGIWVAGSIASTSSSYSGLWWSTDGKNWHQIFGGNKTFRRVYYANGIWVAAGAGLWWSTDGKSWNEGLDTESYAMDYTMFTVYYGNGIWVAGSSSDGLWWSTDGKTWVQGSITSSYAFETVYYANGIWVAGNLAFGLWWSTDGKNWTQSSTTDIQYYHFRTVYYANGIWIAGSSEHGLWHSGVADLGYA